jgi:hypothetical protein
MAAERDGGHLKLMSLKREPAARSLETSHHNNMKLTRRHRKDHLPVTSC